mgnify:FL=1
MIVERFFILNEGNSLTGFILYILLPTNKNQITNIHSDTHKYLQIGKITHFLPTIRDCADFLTALILPKITKGNEKINKFVGYHSTWILRNSLRAEQ